MDINEIKEKKVVVELEIEKILNQFQEATGLNVDRVIVRKLAVFTLGDYDPYTVSPISDVKLEVTL